MSPAPEVEASVIIPVSHADYDDLRHQLAQLARQNTSRGFEVLIADNSGRFSDPSLPANFQIIDASRRPGSEHARNDAARRARGRYLLFCDADDLVSPEWVEAHSLALETHRFTAGPFLVVAPGDQRRLQAQAGEWPSGGFGTRMGRHEGIDFAISANCGIEASLFAEVGGFPDHPRSHDVALSLAVRARGVAPAWVPEAEVVKQDGHRPWRQMFSNYRKIGESRVRLYREYGVGPDVPRLMVRSLYRIGWAVYRTIRRRPSSVTAQAAQVIGVFSEAFTVARHRR